MVSVRRADLPQRLAPGADAPHRLHRTPAVRTGTSDAGTGPRRAGERTGGVVSRRGRSGAPSVRLAAGTRPVGVRPGGDGAHRYPGRAVPGGRLAGGTAPSGPAVAVVANRAVPRRA